jgi:hypothetical protein
VAHPEGVLRAQASPRLHELVMDFEPLIGGNEEGCERERLPIAGVIYVR